MAHNHAVPDPRPLPPDWQRYWNQDINKWYYVQTTMGTPRVAFDHPLDLPPAPEAMAFPPTYPEPHTQKGPGSQDHLHQRLPSGSIPQRPMAMPYPIKGNTMMPGLPTGQPPPFMPKAIEIPTPQAPRPDTITPPLEPLGSHMPHFPYPHSNTLPPGYQNMMPHVPHPHSNTLPIRLPSAQRPPNAQNQSMPSRMDASANVRMPQVPAVSNPTAVYDSPPAGFRSEFHPNNVSGAAKKDKTGKEKKDKDRKKDKEKKKKGKHSHEKSFWGASAMEDPSQGAAGPGVVAMPGQQTMNLAMGVGGQGQIRVQPNIGLLPQPMVGTQTVAPMVGQMGIQNIAPMTGQMGMQNVNTIGQYNPRAPAIDLTKIGSSVAKATTGLLYVTTGLSAQDFSNFRARMTLAFSGVPLDSLGIDAKQFEAVLAGQPGANYQGVINALMIQRQKEQIQMLQTGKPGSNVNYPELIAQVQKMQNSASHKAQQQMAMNAGMQGVQMGVNGMPIGMQTNMQGTGYGGIPAQETFAQQSAILQQQTRLQQQQMQTRPPGMTPTQQPANPQTEANPVIQAGLMGLEAALADDDSNSGDNGGNGSGGEGLNLAASIGNIAIGDWLN